MRNYEKYIHLEAWQLYPLKKHLLFWIEICLSIKIVLNIMNTEICLQSEYIKEICSTKLNSQIKFIYWYIRSLHMKLAFEKKGRFELIYVVLCSLLIHLFENSKFKFILNLGLCPSVADLVFLLFCSPFQYFSLLTKLRIEDILLFMTSIAVWWWLNFLYIVKERKYGMVIKLADK